MPRHTYDEQNKDNNEKRQQEESFRHVMIMTFLIERHRKAIRNSGDRLRDLALSAMKYIVCASHGIYIA